MEYILPGGLENLWARTVTIPAGQNRAQAEFTQGQAIVGILMPAAWTAAKLGYDVSLDNATYVTAYDDAGGYDQTSVQVSSFVAIPLVNAIFAPYIRIKSVDAANVAVNQVADAIIILIFKRYLS